MFNKYTNYIKNFFFRYLPSISIGVGILAVFIIDSLCYVVDNGVWKSFVTIRCLCGHVRLICCGLISPHVVIVVIIAVAW